MSIPTTVKGKISKKQNHDLKNGILYLKGGDLSVELEKYTSATIYNLPDFFEGVRNQTLHEKSFELTSQTATTVMVVAGGYPEAYEKGKVITGLENVEGSTVFHAGTKVSEGSVVTNGGRVMAFTSLGDSMEEALEKSYKNIDKVKFEGMNYRTDIGFDL